MGPSYNAPTVLSRIRDGNSFENTRKSAMDDSTLVLHPAKPPLSQTSKNFNRQRTTVAQRGPKFIVPRVGVATNYGGFRASSEMRINKNIETINRNAFGLDESPDKTPNLEPWKEEEEKGGSADKRW